MVEQNINIKQLPLNCLYAGISLAVMSAAVTPAAAQSVIIINGSGNYQHPAAGYSVYGNSRRVYPQRVIIQQHRGYDYYPGVRQHVIYPQVVHPGASFRQYPGIRQNVYPQVVHPGTRLTPYGTYNSQPIIRQNIIRYSTPVNPMTVNNSWRRTPFGGRSRVIINYP